MKSVVRAIGLCALVLLGPSTAAVARDGATSAASKWTATNPPIDFAHIETGEINRHGEAVGYHHRPNGVDPPGAKVLRVIQRADASGVYRARVALHDPADGQWVDKRAASTFFPDAMSDDEVIQAVLAAFHNGHRRGDGEFVGDFGPRFFDRGLVSIGADQRRLSAAGPVMLRSRPAATRLITARRHPAGYLEGRAARGSGRHGEVLASFLQSDVQGDIEAARSLLSGGRRRRTRRSAAAGRGRQRLFGRGVPRRDYDSQRRRKEFASGTIRL